MKNSDAVFKILNGKVEKQHAVLHFSLVEYSEWNSDIRSENQPALITNLGQNSGWNSLGTLVKFCFQNSEWIS